MFSTQPPPEYFCRFTNSLLLQPHLTSCCGSHLSQETAIRRQKEGKKCPYCHVKEWKTVLDKNLQHKVNSLRAYCYPETRRCTWHGELADFYHHLCSPNRVPWYVCDRVSQIHVNLFSYSSASEAKIVEGNEMHHTGIQVQNVYINPLHIY